MMKYRHSIFLFFCVFLSWHTAFAQNSKLLISGSTTIMPIADAAAKRFMEAYPEVNIVIRGGGSDAGISALISKTCDIATSSRAIQPYEKASAQARDVNPVGYIIANDALQVIVNQQNAVKGLTLLQIRKIYSGQLTNWKQVGGADVPITVIARDLASGTMETFNSKVMGDTKVKNTALVLASNIAVLNAVATTAGAIAYVGFGFQNLKVRALAVNGVLPSTQTVKDKTYPLARALYMYTDGKAQGIAAVFIRFLQSPAGQQIVQKQGFLPNP
jgi:phosphate transport system substrate-binding protein